MKTRNSVFEYEDEKDDTQEFVQDLLKESNGELPEDFSIEMVMT